MKLFTKEIDTKLFEQYLTGSDLENQMVVAKIFNPYGRGTWYLLNSDPEDPEYLWAIVDMDDIEVGSVNRSDLENIRIKPFMLGLERDLSFRQMNALELYEGLNEGKKYIKGGGVEKANFGYLLIADKMKNLAPKSFDAVDEKFAERIKIGMYADGGGVEAENKEMVLNNNKQIAHHTKEISAAVKNAKNVPAWVVAKVNRSATDLSDATHYMEGQGESYAEGGAIYKHKHMDATAKILEKTNKGYKVEFTDNSMKKPKTKIMYFLDINFDKDKGYFEKMETGGGVEKNSNYKKFGKDNSRLVNFDIDDLDSFESMQYDQFSNSMDKADALQILINNTESDYSQLNEQLAKIAEEQYPSDEFFEDNRQYKNGGSVDSIKITKNEFQFRKDEPKRVYHSYEGTLGDYIFYAETDNSFKSGYGSYGINKGSIYKLSIRKVLDNGMHDSIAEYWNKWDYRTKNAKDGAIRSKIIKYIDSISDEKKGTPKKYKQGGEVESKLTGWKHKKK